MGAMERLVGGCQTMHVTHDVAHEALLDRLSCSLVVFYLFPSLAMSIDDYSADATELLETYGIVFVNLSLSSHSNRR